MFTFFIITMGVIWLIRAMFAPRRRYVYDEDGNVILYEDLD